MIDYEARLVGGPNDSQIMGIPSLWPEIKVARLAESPVSMMERDEDLLQPVPIEEHSYRPLRVVVFYGHAEVTTR